MRGGRREIIRKENTKLSLTRQFKLLKISHASIYYAPVGVNAAPLKLMHEIDRVFTKYPFFGSRQIAAYLLPLGNTQGSDVAGFKYAGRQLLRRGVGGGDRKIWNTGNNEYRSGQPIHRCWVDHGFDQR